MSRRPGLGMKFSQLTAWGRCPHVVELYRLNGRVHEVIHEEFPVETQLLVTYLVERNQILYRSIPRCVSAVDEMKVDTGLHAFDQAIADDMGDPSEDVGELRMVIAEQFDGIRQNRSEVVRQRFPR